MWRKNKKKIIYGKKVYGKGIRKKINYIKRSTNYIWKENIYGKKTT